MREVAGAASSPATSSASAWPTSTGAPASSPASRMSAACWVAGPATAS